MNVAIVGASNKPERYSYKAVMLLKEKGHTPYPIHPALREIEQIPVFASLSQVPVPLDVVSVYLSHANQRRIEQDILHCGARRVIFNPGSENPELSERLRAVGTEVMNACTLVLLKTGQFNL